jgi:hypothetical protein
VSEDGKAKPAQASHLLDPTRRLEDPAQVGDVVATIYKDSSGSRLYVEPLPPQSLDCVAPAGMVGCPVARVWYGLANVTAQQQADAEWLYRGPSLERNCVLVVGHLANVTVRDHRSGHDHEPVDEIWFMVKKLYLTPRRGRVIERHSPQFFYTTGTVNDAQAVAISQGEQSSRPAQITWTGMVTYNGGSGPSSVEDMFVTGEADFTHSPLRINADEYFVRQTR